MDPNEKIQEAAETARELADRLLELAEESSRLGDDLAKLEMERPEKWLKMRGNFASDKATDRTYEATPDGKREIWLHAKLKANDRLSSAIRAKLRVLENEARNIY